MCAKSDEVGERKRKAAGRRRRYLPTPAFLRLLLHPPTLFPLRLHHGFRAVLEDRRPPRPGLHRWVVEWRAEGARGGVMGERSSSDNFQSLRPPAAACPCLPVSVSPSPPPPNQLSPHSRPPRPPVRPGRRCSVSVPCQLGVVVWQVEWRAAARAGGGARLLSLPQPLAGGGARWRDACTAASAQGAAASAVHTSHSRPPGVAEVSKHRTVGLECVQPPAAVAPVAPFLPSPLIPSVSFLSNAQR